MKFYKLEHDLVDPTKHYIYEYSEYSVKIKLIIHSDYELACRIFSFLQETNEGNE